MHEDCRARCADLFACGSGCGRNIQVRRKGGLVVYQNFRCELDSLGSLRRIRVYRSRFRRRLSRFKPSRDPWRLGVKEE